MDDLRKPFLFAAVILMLVVVLVEIGAGVSLRGAPPPTDSDPIGSISGALPTQVKGVIDGMDSGSKQKVQDLTSASTDVPGYGIPYMAVLDGMVLFTVILITTPLILTDQVQGRIQGCATLILAILLILASIAMIIAAIIFLLLMVALLLAIPFGTLVYLAIYGFFDGSGASKVLSLLMFLKIVFAICLVLAQQRFLQNRGLVLIVISSLVANVVVSFLQGFVPGILVSITDDIAGIIVAACGCIWWILALIGAIPAILKALRPQT